MLHHHQAYQIAQPSPPALNWHNLYDACLSANPAEQTAAYQRLWDLLLRRAHYCLFTKPRLHAEAADCAQEALLDIWKGLAAHRGPSQQAQSFQSWCLTIVSRRVLDLLRRPAYQLPDYGFWEVAEEQDIADGLDVEETVVGRLSLTTLFQDVLNHPALTPLQRQVLWLHCVEELDYAEIAQRLHKNATTIRVNRHRALVALQKDTALLARIGALLDAHHPCRQQDTGRQGIDW